LQEPAIAEAILAGKDRFHRGLHASSSAKTATLPSRREKSMLTMAFTIAPGRTLAPPPPCRPAHIRILSMSQTAASPALQNAFFTAALADADPEIAQAISLELGRQQHEIELIASENIVSKAVLEAQGSVMTNKYAEGYPGRRYYGGCQFVDMAENLAIERVTRLFDCKYANVQPNSGSQANQGVFLALMQPGDTFMGLDLAAGGHLTHGSPVNLSG